MMRIVFVFFVLTISCSHKEVKVPIEKSSQANPASEAKIKYRDPVLVHLFSKVLYHGHGPSCWNDQNQLEADCEVTEPVICSMKKVFSSPNSVEIKFDLGDLDNRYHRSIFIQPIDVDLQYPVVHTSQGFGKSAFKVPIGARLRIFTYRSMSPLEYHGDFVVPPSVILKMTKSIPAQKRLTLKLPIDADFKDKHFSVFVGNHFVDSLSLGKAVVVYWHEPDFEIRIVSGDKKYLYKKKFVVFERPEVFILDKSELVANEIDVLCSQLDWMDDYFGVGRHDDPSPSGMTGIFKVNKMELAEKQKDLSGFFEISKSHLKLKEEFKTEFKQLTGNLPYYSLDMDLELRKVFKWANHKSYDVFSGPSADHLLGKLLIRTKYGRGEIIYQNSGENEHHEINASIFHGHCEPHDSLVFIHQGLEAKGDWVNLGMGPWGQFGWIQAPYKRVFGTEPFTLPRGEDGSNLELRFEYVSDEMVIGRGRKIIRNKNYEEESTAVEYQYDYDEIFDEKGNFLFGYTCEYGC